MKTIKGPGIFLAQFADNQAPFNSLEGMAHWAAQLGIRGGADSYVGSASFRSEACGGEPRLLRGDSWDSRRGRFEADGAFNAFAGTAGRHRIRHTM